MGSLGGSGRGVADVTATRMRSDSDARVGPGGAGEADGRRGSASTRPAAPPTLSATSYAQALKSLTAHHDDE